MQADPELVERVREICGADSVAVRAVSDTRREKTASSRASGCAACGLRANAERSKEAESARRGRSESTTPLRSDIAQTESEGLGDALSGSKTSEKQRQLEIDALERDVAELSRLTDPTDATAAEIERMRREVDELKREFYAHLGAWQRLQLARHPQRPYTDDFIRLLFENFSEIHGDRNFADDPAH